uniref:Fibronectin type-III domain-containing protein 3A-like n=1 Tax=Phallusia mammillata TaxID=59560 RepID=A0A6F9DCE3_9ASCI|nr:fibronectin type-III domain-containing protein 3A-like [Phallusia mammillata]
MPVPTMENSNVATNRTPEYDHHLQRSEGLCHTNERVYDRENPSSENVILVQVNPGETFTIQDDGSYRSIPGPAQVPMVFNNGAIPTINVPPGYISQVIEENGVRKVVVLPSTSTPGLDSPNTILAHHAYHQPHLPFHSFIQSPVQPAIFQHSMIPSRPDGSMQFAPPIAAYFPDENHPTGLSDSSLSSPNNSTHSINNPPMHSGSPLPNSLSTAERMSKKLQERQQRNQPPKNSPESSSSLTSSPSSSSSFVPSQSASPDSHNMPFSNGHPQNTSFINLSPEHIGQHHIAHFTIPNRQTFPVFPKNMQLITDRVKLAENDHQTSNDVKGTSQSEGGCSTLSDLLSSISKPTVLDLKPRKVHLVWPQLTTQSRNVTDELQNSLDSKVINFELMLSCQKKSPGKFEVVYSGLNRFYQLTDLRPATDYCAKVLAMCDAHKGQPSELLTFHTPSCEPDTPAPPKLSSRTKNNILLKWVAPADNGEKIVKYHLEWDEGNHGSGFQLLFSSSQKQYKVTKLSPAHSYKFRLAAENKIGTSGWSTEVCYQTAGTVPTSPEAPRLVKATVKSLSLQWLRASGDVTSFTLEMDESAGYGFRPIYNGLDTKFTVKNLRRSYHYRFRLCCHNNEGKGKWSSVVSFLTCPDKPQAPGKPKVKGIVHAKFFKLTWDAPNDDGGSDVQFYTMEMSRERNRPMKVIYTGADQECLVEDLEPGHTYRLRVFCSTAGGASLPSEVAMVTTPPVISGACDAPMIALRPKPTCLTVKWDSPQYAGGTSVSHYEVSCKPSGDPTVEGTAPVIAYKGAERECTVGGLRPGTQYDFQVRPINKVGIGPWSEPLLAVTSAGTPEKVDLPVATVLSATSVHIQWQSPTDNGAEIIGYRVQWGSAESSMSVVTVGPVLSHHLHCLTPNTIYLFTVQAVNSVGQGAVSDVGSVTTLPSCPQRVINLRQTVTETTDDDEICGSMSSQTGSAIQWDAPHDNGCEITSYKIHVAEQRPRGQRKDVVDGTESKVSDHVYEVEPDATVYCFDDLKPDTQYSIKVCAVNSIGCGSFSEAVELRTRPLPPDAPALSCVQTTSNSLKLKWGDGKSSFTNSIQYLLQMRDKNGRFVTVYRGSSCSHRIHRLNEDTTYRFRINASNSEGEGQFSAEFAATTSVQMPPIMEAPSVSSVQPTSCEISWQKVDSIKGDTIQYRLSLENLSDPKSKMEQTCDRSRYLLDRLTPDTEYRLRVAAVRQYHAGIVQTPTDTDESEEQEQGVTLLQSTFSAASTFHTQTGEQSDEVTPRLTPRTEEAPVSDSSVTVDQRHVTVADEASPQQQPPEFSVVAASESISENKRSAIWLAVYLLFAIFMAFAAQIYVVK